MAFWKKSEDPWDRKPEKRPVIQESPSEDSGRTSETEKESWNPGKRLDDWLEKRRTAAKEKEKESLLPPEKCPWCGQDMTQGYLITGRDSIHWYPGVYKTAWFSKDKTGAFRVDCDGALIMYKITWHCESCQKMVFDASNLQSLTDPYIQKDPFDEQTEEQEESGEE